MTDKKISELVAVTTVEDTDEYVLARAGASNKITGANLKAAAGGGSSPYLSVTVPITDAQIKALNTTAIQLLPPVSGALILPVSVTWLFSPIGTTAYTVPGQLYVDPCDIFTSTGGTGLVPAGLTSLLQTSPAVEQVTVDDFLAGLTSLFNGLIGVLLASMVNQPVMLRTDTGNPTLGDSGLSAVIVYQVVAVT